MSEMIGVYAAICKVTRDLSKFGITKDRKNEQQGYAFRGIDDVYNAMSLPLAEAGLCILPHYKNRTCEERQTARGGAIYNITVEGTFELVGPDGSRHEVGPFFGEAMDTGDKATNKAMSAAFKYMCMQVFCIPTAGENDADAKTPPETIPKTGSKAEAQAVAEKKIAELKSAPAPKEQFPPDPEDLKGMLDQIARDPNAASDIGEHFKNLIEEAYDGETWLRVRKASLIGKPPLETAVRRLYWTWKSKDLAAK